MWKRVLIELSTAQRPSSPPPEVMSVPFLDASGPPEDLSNEAAGPEESSTDGAHFPLTPTGHQVWELMVMSPLSYVLLGLSLISPFTGNVTSIRLEKHGYSFPRCMASGKSLSFGWLLPCYER